MPPLSSRRSCRSRSAFGTPPHLVRDGYEFSANRAAVGQRDGLIQRNYTTAELRKHGVKVGVFGASVADIDDRPSPYDDDEDAGW